MFTCGLIVCCLNEGYCVTCVFLCLSYVQHVQHRCLPSKLLLFKIDIFHRLKMILDPLWVKSQENGADVVKKLLRILIISRLIFLLELMSLKKP